jgi:parallel beta-helix repeat protein
MKKTATVLLLAVLMTCIASAIFNTEKVWASGTIYIRPDGSIDPPPPTTPINRDGDTYTITADIYETIVVQKDNIIIDGNSYALQGTGSGTGFDLFNRNNVTIKNTRVAGWNYGVHVYSRSSGNTIRDSNLTNNDPRAIFISNSSDNTVRDNLIVNNSDGIFLWLTNNTLMTENKVSGNGQDGISIGYLSFNNVINNNTLSDNGYAGVSLGYETLAPTNNVITYNNIANNSYAGIHLDHMSGNTLHHNNLIDNERQVVTVGATNTWDNGYLSGGNYWSNYTGADLNGDGIGDTPYIIDADNQDNYPFMNPWTPQAYDIAIDDVEPSKTFVGQGYDVRINVTVTNQGSYTQTFNVTAYANQTKIETRTISVAGQSSETLTFTWNTAGITKALYTLNATADQIPGEIDTLDNIHKNGNIKVTIAGDVNGDAIVNVHDLFLIGEAYGSTPPNTNWNSNCDINEDNTVSKPDLEIAGSNYSKTA